MYWSVCVYMCMQYVTDNLKKILINKLFEASSCIMVFIQFINIMTYVQTYCSTEECLLR